MKRLQCLTLAAAAVFLFTASADAQRRPARRPAPTPTPRAVLPSLDVRKARETVSNQQFNVTKFVEILASVGGDVENLDKEWKTQRISSTNKASFDQHEARKKKLVEAISGLRAGLVNLENEFRSKPALRGYLPQLQGIAALSAQSEDAAIAGRFVDARKPLITVGGKLADTLAVMPGAAGSSLRPGQFRRGVSIGMTGAEVRASSWGAPIRISRVSRTTERWHYSGNRSISLVNGKVTTISP